jgi:hypothetical protein
MLLILSRSASSKLFPYLRFPMFPSAKNTTPFWYPQSVNFQEKSSYPFGSYPKPQISDLVVLAVPFSIRDILSSVSKGVYRYGMNTQEKDNEIYGEGNSYTAEYWQYDARLGRRWNVDPKPNPSTSTYAAFANNPIWFSDVAGDTIIFPEISGSESFGWTFQKDLNKLYNSKTGANLIRELHSTTVKIEFESARRWYHNFTSEETAILNSETRSKDVDGVSTKRFNTVLVTYYGDNKTNINGITAYSYMVLAHEMQHAIDIASGYVAEVYSKFAKKEIFRPKDYDLDDIMEMRALFIANKIALELGLPKSEIRTHYGDRRLLLDDGITPAVSFGDDFNPLEGL